MKTAGGDGDGRGRCSGVRVCKGGVVLSVHARSPLNPPCPALLEAPMRRAFVFKNKTGGRDLGNRQVVRFKLKRDWSGGKRQLGRRNDEPE